MSYYIRKSGESYFIRYGSNTAWIYYPDALSLCETCCPIVYLSRWEDPTTVACSQTTYNTDLEKPYYYWYSGNNPVPFGGGQANIAPSSALNLFCGTPPTARVSRRITVNIPYDPVFSGNYVFDRKADGSWDLNNHFTTTNISTYQDSTSAFYNTKLIDLTETYSQSTYQGYVEYATTGSATTTISGAFAFPARFVFSAIQPPTDVDGYEANSPTNNSPFPQTTGHRMVVGFKLPLRWRHPYSDWILVDKIGHRVSGIVPTTSGYATGVSGTQFINLSGITNNPARYDITDSVTAITGSCTGLSHIGFAYKVSASGLPFQSSTYGISLSSFTGIKQDFNKYNITYNSTTHNLDETRLFGPKESIEAWVSFDFSCRPSGSWCSEFSTMSPVSTGSTSISGSCFGSSINADFMCGDNLARPSGAYWTSEGITGIKIVYSGTSDNIYPLIKTSDNTGNLFKAGSGQVVYIPYSGNNDPDSFRSWITSNFNFVKVDNSNIITQKYTGTDLYWYIKNKNTASAEAWARLIPEEYENACTGLSVNAGSNEFDGRYSYSQSLNRYVNVANNNVQIRFVVDRWYMGIVSGATFTIYYILTNTTGGDPVLSDSWFADYSDYVIESTYGDVLIPVTCNSVPIGTWSNDSGNYPGVGSAQSTQLSIVE